MEQPEFSGIIDFVRQSAKPSKATGNSRNMRVPDVPSFDQLRLALSGHWKTA
jgi:hypothetical protein